MGRAIPRALLKKLFASSALLRRNSYPVPWYWLVPDLEAKLMMPPVAWPNSALNPLVSTVNSVIASMDGALTATQLFVRARVVLAETPSRLVPYPAACPPPRAKSLSPPKFLASGVIEARLKGLRMVPPTTSGSSSTSLLLMVTLDLAFSVESESALAETSTAWIELPTSSVASARTVAEALRTRP